MLRTFFRVINSILFTAAFFAAAYFGYYLYLVLNFPSEECDAREADLLARAAQTRAAAMLAREDTAQRLALLKADLKNNGEEAVSIAESMDALTAEQELKVQKLAQLRELARIREDMPGSVKEARRQYGLKIRELEEKIQSGESEIRICYWTFDDGPTYITKDFLDALDGMDGRIRVSFFTANEANDAPNEEEMLRREMTSGHSVQNHTFAHVTDIGGAVYRSLDDFREQIVLQDEWLFEVTGFHPLIFRFPGGSAWGRDLVPDALDAINELGYEWVDWNCNLYDAGAADKLPTAALETTRAVTQASEEPIAMILSHDWNRNTLIAMKAAIPQLQEKGYVFLPLFPESVTMGLVAYR